MPPGLAGEELCVSKHSTGPGHQTAGRQTLTSSHPQLCDGTAEMLEQEMKAYVTSLKVSNTLRNLVRVVRCLNCHVSAQCCINLMLQGFYLLPEGAWDDFPFRNKFFPFFSS